MSLSKAEGYIHLEEIEWTADRLAQGLIVKLKEVPFKVRLFKVVAPNGDIDRVTPAPTGRCGVTNDLAETVTSQVAQDANDVAGKSKNCIGTSNN